MSLTCLAISSWRFSSLSSSPRITFSDFAELLSLRERLELLQRLVLDLADPLAGDVEGPADLIQRPRMLAAQPVAELEHAALAVGEVLEGLLQGLLGEQLSGPLEGG